jgi:large subunit ribosomal protein L35
MWSGSGRASLSRYPAALDAMPKMKTHSGAKKRFKLTGKGKVKARHAFTSHILEKKSPKRKRRLGNAAILSDHDAPRVKNLLNAKKK